MLKLLAQLGTGFDCASKVGCPHYLVNAEIALLYARYINQTQCSREGTLLG